MIYYRNHGSVCDQTSEEIPETNLAIKGTEPAMNTHILPINESSHLEFQILNRNSHKRSPV